MLRGVYGINIAVRDLEAATQTYERVLGVKPTPMKASDFAFPGLRGSAFRMGSVTIHLITSENNNTSVGKFLESRGEGLFLLSLLSDDIEQDIKHLKEDGLKVILEESASGSFGKVNFVHPKSMNGVQLEIIQPPTLFGK